MESPEWLLVEKKPVRVRARRLEQRVEIDTREGTVVGEPGDYIIVGVDGEVYPCDPGIFRETHHVVRTTGGAPETDEIPEELLG